MYAERCGKLKLISKITNSADDPKGSHLDGRKAGGSIHGIS
jgi:hypothetical protein